MSIVTRATAKTYFETGDTPTQAQFGDLIDSTLFPGDQDLGILAMQALGSPVLAVTVGAVVGTSITAAVAINDGTAQIHAVYLPVAATVTGVKFYASQQGAFTGDNTNAIGLYSYSGGTCTKVAESANDANIWKATIGTWKTVAFASTYAAAAGIYFVVALYNSSAQTQAPSMGAIPSLSAGTISSFDFTNSAKFYSTLASQATLPSSFAMSTTTATSSRVMFELY